MAMGRFPLSLPLRWVPQRPSVLVAEAAPAGMLLVRVSIRVMVSITVRVSSRVRVSITVRVSSSVRVIIMVRVSIRVWVSITARVSSKVRVRVRPEPADAFWPSQGTCAEGMGLLLQGKLCQPHLFLRIALGQRFALRAAPAENKAMCPPCCPRCLVQPPAAAALALSRSCHSCGQGNSGQADVPK